jgi:hypothetical protein
MNALTISIAAQFDLYQSGYPISEEDALDTAWREAMESIAEALGLDVHIVSTSSYQTPAAHEQTRHSLGDDEAPLETVLWQAAHDLCSRASDGTWTATKPGSERIEGLRRCVELAAL